MRYCLTVPDTIYPLHFVGDLFATHYTGMITQTLSWTQGGHKLRLQQVVAIAT